ncbi:hypothetical protein [Winogradskyella immobilis]|uniref:TonB-dependent receptor plug domain-containing protein n=1 Tax=Winogradskyella immobilis TaxID=2816852 RepID=A0ABS8EN23_9FLAO|nr:hypothetical protein [Winogradskyella immobilis]MCC1484543.1 hypothetical protein [Winogradskyella immobilis]MCG0016635.1 hypothetical protein [Winogradskyella immobilis]
MKRYILSILVFVFYLGYAQEEDSSIIDSFEDYADLTREQVYLHFNKSTYIVGEMLGFNAYVFIKDSKQLSDNTTNLYCQIVDTNDKVIKEKLLLVTSGVSRGEFEIDSLFATGEYRLKAYTNWMRNFTKEHNYFLENFKVINPLTNRDDKPQAVSDEIDVQFLPESGHLLEGTDNVIGIIAKDKLGNGISNLRLKLYDDTNTELTETILNEYGIGNFILNPKPGEIYTVKYSYNQKRKEQQLLKAENKGVVLSIKELPRKNSIAVSIKTNDNTLDLIKGKRYKLSIHNGSEIKELQFAFTDLLEVSQTVSLTQLFPGINIFTVFDNEDRPIAERMYFNYKGLNLAPQDYTIFNTINNDSIEIRVTMPNVKLDQFQNLSVSVLPSKTKSYEHHQNIISSLYLQPYLREAVEQADYYFSDITAAKKYELDNLLLTLGWSSYDWGAIFNEPPEPYYDFEVGINYTINRNDNKIKNYIIYPNINSNSEILTLEEGQKSFEKRGFFPLDDETIRIGESKKGEIGKANLSMQYSLLDIKPFTTNHKSKTILSENQSGNTVVEEFKDAEGEILDEVKIFASRGYSRIEDLQNRRIGKVTEFNDELFKQYKTLAQFLSSKGYIVEERPQVTGIGDDTEYSTFRIYNRSRRSLAGLTYEINGVIYTNPGDGLESPRIYLDGVLLSDLDFLVGFSMETVDYIEINKGGVGEGFRGGFGTIRIVTDPKKRLLTQKSRTSYSEYKIPLTFTSPKQFYIPKYRSFESPFFNEYGVVDWFPNVVVGNDGYLTLKVLDTGVPIKLFIEGVVNTEQLMSDVITIGEN